LSVGIGAAQAKKLNNDNHLVYTLHGDGITGRTKLGSDHVCSAKKVDNIIATIDLNGKQIDGSTDEVLAMGSIRKFEALTGM
jgi:transketolase